MQEGVCWKLDEIKQYVKERDEMLLKCDVKELRKFVKEHKKQFAPDFVRAMEIAADEVLEITLHKMIVNCTNLPFDFRQKSADWLLDRHYSLEL
jgi:hypothetical protein